MPDVNPEEILVCDPKTQTQFAERAVEFDGGRLVRKRVGQMTGLEPASTGTTIRGLNHLATPAISPIVHINTRFSLIATPGKRLAIFCKNVSEKKEG